MQAIFIWTEYLNTASDATYHLKINLKFLQHLLCVRMANIAFIVFLLPFISSDVRNIWHRHFRIFDNQ